jgi:hypothetical protein
MRNLLVFLMTVLFCISMHSQNCPSPVTTILFQQKMNQFSTIRQDQQRLAAANDFVLKNCLLTYQVKQIAELFNDDVTRLEFVQNAYPIIFDKENVYDLYDAFAYFSSVMRLHDYIASLSERVSRPERGTDISYRPYSFPDYNYPSYENYHETTPCSQPISDEVFYRLLHNVMMNHDDDARVNAAIELAENNCLTVAQIMKMGSLIEQETKRLDYLKRSYDYTYDVGNFQYSNQLFKEKSNSTDLDNYVRDRKGRPGKDSHNHGDRENRCRLSDTEMLDIVKNIKDQSFENTQLTMTKQIVRSKQCFTTVQIKQLIDIFSFESTKLDIAKYCYAYCIDRDNYYKLNSSFSFSSSVDDLTKFINEQH